MTEVSTPAGYLLEDFRLFHLKDQIAKTYHFHHHDFFKDHDPSFWKCNLCSRRPFLSLSSLGYGPGGPGTGAPAHRR